MIKINQIITNLNPLIETIKNEKIAKKNTIINYQNEYNDIEHIIKWDDIKKPKKTYNVNKRIKKLEILLKNKIRNFDKKIIQKQECKECKAKNKLEIHHINYIGKRKLIVLCHKCHKKTHTVKTKV